MGGPAPCAPNTPVRCSPSGQKRRGPRPGAWERPEHPKSRRSRSDRARGGAQARFASYPEMWPHPTHGKTSVLGPHWPNLLRMTRGRWTNKRVGKTAGPQLPGRPHHDSHSRSGVLTRLKFREVRGDAGRKQGSLYFKPSDYLQSHAPSAAGCRPGGAGRDGTPRARVTLKDLQSPLFTGA